MVKVAPHIEGEAFVKFVMPGGTGQVGTVLKRALSAAGHGVVVLSRRPSGPGEVHWDGVTQGPWAAEIDGCDVVVNLAGRSVNCRYTPGHLRQMMDSRVVGRTHRPRALLPGAGARSRRGVLHAVARVVAATGQRRPRKNPGDA